ncbi:MAG: hypothetical protein PHX27_01175 [Candidatus ainarchaeum sp.]|nr:hypothetical protein [Candidatus ainarchaeum sp.]
MIPQDLISKISNLTKIKDTQLLEKEYYSYVKKAIKELKLISEEILK